MSKSRIKYLLNLYLDGNISREQLVELKEFLLKDGSKVLFLEQIERTLTEFPVDGGSDNTLQGDKLFMNILKDVGTASSAKSTTPVRRMNIWPKVAIAVSLILLVGLFWFMNPTSEKQNILTNNDRQINDPATEILPGANKATLTLADGNVVSLDEQQLLKKGTSQGASDLVMDEEGGLVYHLKNDNNQSEVVMNTLNIPKAGQYKLQLADGTIVWMNAASTLRYPTSFPGETREVELTGEAYFEVTRNIKKPFIVKLENETMVQVLGTSFNIHAYNDEPDFRTTLLTGKVRVSTGHRSRDLLVGQQSRTDKNGNMTVMNNVDMEEVVAWKNGQFVFKSADLRSLLNPISRWYDIEVEYRGNYPEDKFRGTFSRSANLSQVLKILELSEINFRLEDRRLIVLPPSKR